MKKLTTLITTVLLTTMLWAQSPEKLSYQAVVRDASNNLVTNTTIGMQISVLQGTASGSAVYVETQTPTSNANGLVTIEIAEGTVVSGDFSAIDWANGPYFVKTETDPTGGTNYTITGTSQILSVPYALHAKTAETADYYSLSNLPVLFDGDWNSLSGTIPNISIFTNDAAYLTEDTTLNEAEVDAFVANNGYLTSEVDGSITNEIQNLNSVLVQGNSGGNQNISNIADPVNNQDAATKAYVDALFEELYSEGALRVRDFDNNYYNTIKIGNQTWMAENLRTTHYNDGTLIDKVTDNGAWAGLTTAAYCWYANDSTANAFTYGAFYNWYAVNTGNLCPIGWRVPTHDEWTTLTDYLGTASIAGGKLKETGTTHWSSPNTGATNETGFTARPGGSRGGLDGLMVGMTSLGFWWTSTQESTLDAWNRSVIDITDNVYSASPRKTYGYSVRCLKD